MKRTRSRRGFTLVEMMIVVLIIGILVAIALPNFLKARENARTRACAANMKQIQGAIEVWAMETKQPGSATPADISTLVSGGYLKTTPTCPSGGTYTISGNVANYTISCSIHGDLVNLINSL